MIVRILGEGQYDVPDSALDRLNQLDTVLEQAVDSGDDVAFTTALQELLEGVRSAGSPHDLEALDESDLILPPPDASVDEVRALMDDEGLIPG